MSELTAPLLRMMMIMMMMWEGSWVSMMMGMMSLELMIRVDRQVWG